MPPLGDIDVELCRHYAAFMSRLSRRQFDILYWTLFLVVIVTLFASSWIYQRAMMYRDKPNYCEKTFRKKLISALISCTLLFVLSAVFCVVEVYCLLALQFCDGEYLMSLFWSTFTMLQLGSEIAILGIILALWHSIVDIRHPMWSLALGTPVLVVAGFGHVLQYAFESCWKSAKRRHRERSRRNSRQSIDKSYVSSSATSIKPEREQVEEKRMMHDGLLEAGRQKIYFTMEVDGDERVKQWPSFVGMSQGKAVLQLTPTPHALPGFEAKKPLPPTPGPSRP